MILTKRINASDFFFIYFDFSTNIIKLYIESNNYICTMKLFLITIVMMSFIIAAIAIKILLKKDGEFAGTCASQSPFLSKDGEDCSFCGKSADEICPNN